MASNIITISVPPLMGEFVKYRMKSGRYASVSEYFRELIKQDEEREIARLEEIKRGETRYCGRSSGKNYR